MPPSGPGTMAAPARPPALPPPRAYTRASTSTVSILFFEACCKSALASPDREDKDACRPPELSGLEAAMSELVDRVVSNVGLDRPTAEKAVGILLDFLSTEGPAHKERALLAGLPGSEALL